MNVTRIITFLRHVQSLQNEGRPHGPNKGIWPTETGVFQIDTLERLLPGVRHFPKPDRLDSSPFDRTIMTAMSPRNAYGLKDIFLDNDLGEFTPFDVKRGKIITAREKYPTLKRYRENATPDYRVPVKHRKLVQGETFNEFLGRIDGYMDRVLQQDDWQSLMAVTHGNWLRVMTLHKQYPKRDAATLLDQMNAYSVPYNPDAVQLIYKDDGTLKSIKHYMFAENFAYGHRYPVLKEKSGNTVNDAKL